MDYEGPGNSPGVGRNSDFVSGVLLVTLVGFPQCFFQRPTVPASGMTRLAGAVDSRLFGLVLRLRVRRAVRLRF
jgi:hypothetical protein